MGSPQQPSVAKAAIVCDEIRRIEDSESALRAELEAWKASFGTSQLTHAVAKLDKAINENAQLRHKLAGYEKQWTDMDYTIGECRRQLEALKKERDELRRDLAERGDQIAQAARHDFACFRCGDGSTPLYCLNCAEEMLRIKCTDKGEIAYEAYRRSCNYWTPTWEELKPDIQAGFSAAAKGC